MKGRTKITFSVSQVWRQVTEDLKVELIEFWKRNRAIGDPIEARHRADQAVCIARDKDGEICAVSTAELRVLPRMQQPLYYFRLFFSKSVRGQQQVFPFYNIGRQVLQDYNNSLAEPESLGVLLELESPHLIVQGQRVYVKEVDSVFIGYSPRGLQLRVSYFDDATLLKPEAVMSIVRNTRAVAA